MIDLNLLIIFNIAILGLVLGSFLNVVIIRIDKGESFMRGRSRCPSCKKILGFWDLFPILSFVFLQGKCRYCKKAISYQYPLVEFFTSFFLVFLYLNIGGVKENINALAGFANYPLFVTLGIVFLCLIVIFVYDLIHYLIPDEVVLFGILTISLAFLYAYFFIPGTVLYPHFLGMIIFSGFFAFQYFISKGKWVGWGDVKLGLLLGLLLGWKLTVVSLMIAYIVGAVISLVLIWLGKKTRKDIIPFGPFLIASSVFSLFYGNIIISWYLNLLYS